MLSKAIGFALIPGIAAVHFASLYKVNVLVVVILLGFDTLHVLAPPLHTEQDPLVVVQETQFELHELSVHTVIPIC